jgi:hypothetical protein
MNQKSTRQDAKQKQAQVGEKRAGENGADHDP